MMKVSFKSSNLTEFKLLRVNKSFFENNNDKSSKYFFANSGFMISQDYNFLISTYEMTIPTTIRDRSIDKTMSIYTNTEQERYDLLLKVRSALLEWSKSIYWLGEKFSDTPKIKFSNKLWILY